MITFYVYWKSVRLVSNIRNITDWQNRHDGSYINRGIYGRRPNTIQIFNKKKKKK
jgi:hypothetical protein